jgi:HSP20 family protein
MAVWDPFRDLARIEREMRRIFDDFWGGPRRREALLGPGRPSLPTERAQALVGAPAVDLIDKKDALVFRAEMPGLKKKDIKISVTEDEISVSGKVERAKEEKEESYYCCERVYSSWQRTIPLPVKVKAEQVKAKYQDGVLEITLPKTEKAKAKPKAKEIKIE